MTSPAGLPFCVCDESWPHERPGTVGWPSGHRSRVVQLSIDVPSACYDAELSFWQAATGWADEPVRRPEFRRLVHRAQSPLQLLVQRLGADNLAGEVARVEALGAQVLWPGDGFVALEGRVPAPV